MKQTTAMVPSRPGRVEQQGLGLWRVTVKFPNVLIEVAAGFIHDGDHPGFLAFPGEHDPTVPGGGVDVGDPQVKGLLDASGGIEEEQDDCRVTQAAAGLLSGARAGRTCLILSQIATSAGSSWAQ